MAFTSTSPYSSSVTSVTSVQTDADATATNDITGGTNLVLTTVEIDCATNSVQAAVYLKFYDDGNPTVGTTDPVFVIPMAASTRGVFQISGGGYTFTNAISFACVTDGGGTAGTTSPATNVIVRVTTE